MNNKLNTTNTSKKTGPLDQNKEFTPGVKHDQSSKDQAIVKKNLAKIENSKVYKATKTIHKLLDDYFLDPLIGLIPVVGDGVTSVFVLPYLYVSIFKLRSVSLSLAIVFNILLDFTLGLIPFYVGNAVDVFHKAHKKNFKLLQGFIHHDRKIMREVKSKAIFFGLGILALVVAIYYMIKLAAKFVSWFWDILPF